MNIIQFLRILWARRILVIVAFAASVVGAYVVAMLVQPRYDWRGGGAPRLLYVTVFSSDTVRSAKTLLELAGRLPRATPTAR